MRKEGRFLLGLLAFVLAAAPAPAQDSAEGFYVTEVREMASMLELAPGGRFRWALSYGALDMAAQGRWRLEDGAVLLDTEPPVRPPGAELIGTGREPGGELIVRVSDPAGRTPDYLTVEAEYESGAPDHARLQGDAYHVRPDRGRRIVAIRILISGAGYRSERFEVPRGTNVMRLRFSPNDFGRADFRGTRAAIDGDAILLPVLGEPLRYRRLTAEEQAEYQGVIEDISEGAGAAPSVGSSGVTPVEISGPLELGIGAPIDRRLLPSEQGDGQFGASGSIELRVRLGGMALDFGRIGGEGRLALGVQAPGPGQEVSSVNFGYQDRLLTLAEALARARNLSGRLRDGGFVERTPRPGRLEWPSFFMIFHARDGEEAFLSGASAIRGSDWEAAERLLADPAIGAVTMHLFTLAMADVEVMVLAEHAPRLAEREDAGLGLGETGGRDWFLNVTIRLDPALRRQQRMEAGPSEEP